MKLFDGRLVRIALSGVVFVWLGNPVSAYTPILTHHEHLVRWNLDEIPEGQPNIIEGSVEFFMNRLGTADIADNGDGTGGEFDIIRRAFRVWEEQSTSLIDFNDLKITDQTFVTLTDETNVIIFDETDRTGLFPPGTGIIAYTLLTFEDEAFDGVLDGRIRDADLVFNGRDWQFSEDLQPNRINLMAVAVHEIGHICGLDHAFDQKTNEVDDSVITPTMFPSIGYAEDQAATLKPDDIAGMVELYPNDEINSILNGSISGLVTIAGQPGFGVNVVAYNGDIPVVGTYTRADGTYRIEGVPEGTYLLRTHTLSPQNIGLVFDVSTEFHSQFYAPMGVAGISSDASPVTVKAGKRRANLNFNLIPFTEPDFFEPNDSQGQATLLATDGRRMIQQFYQVNDVDWVKFNANQGTIYELETDNLGIFSDPAMELYGTDGTTFIAQSDNINPSKRNRAARIRFTANSSGIHFVKLFSPAAVQGAAGSFEFHIGEIGAAILDANSDNKIDTLDLFSLSHDWYTSPAKGVKSVPDFIGSDLLLDLIEALRR
jgi:hypothetical protein